MRLPRSSNHSLSARTVLKIGIAILLFGILPVAAIAGTTQIAFTPANLRFGATVVGQTETLPVTLVNSGETSVTIFAIGSSNPAFTVSSVNMPLILAAGASANLSISFAPTEIGWAGGAIRFSTGNSNASIRFEIWGNGVSSQTVTASPALVSFGQVAIGGVSTVPVVLTNSRSWSVTLSGFQTVGAGFSISAPGLPLNLGPGQSAKVNVTFSPQSAGTAGGSLYVSGPSPGLTIPLNGTGAPAGQLNASLGSLNFANVQVGTSQTQSVTLSNSGGSSLTISQAALTGTGFTISGLAVPQTLGAGQSATFSVVFAPQSAGGVSGNLALSSNASDSSVNIPLSGSAVTPGQLTASPASLAFGSIQAGGNATLTDSITNTGGSSVTLSGASVTGTGFGVSGLSFPLVLNPGASVTFSVVFAPQSSVSATGSITVGSNASNTSLVVSLSGTGTAQGQLTVAPTAVNFGTATVGTVVTQTSSLTAGGSSVTVSSASMSSSEFSLTGVSFPVTIPAGQSMPVTLTFSPQASGTATGVLSVTSNASNAAAQTLNGVGVAPVQHSVSLSWADTGSGIVGYNVYRGNVSGGPYAQINSAMATNTAYSDSSVASGQTYYYVTTAVDGSGTESTYSNEAQGVIPTP
jgi:Abnormal spindle-like microcephaly-assoc'd, ASPM-SPD-2-Hydin